MLIRPIWGREGVGALNFQFGIGMQPEGPKRGACEQTTANFLGP